MGLIQYARESRSVRAVDLVGTLAANCQVNVILHIVSDSVIQLLTVAPPRQPAIGVVNGDGHALVKRIDENLSADITQTGAGGRDGGSEQNGVRYYVWLIYNPSNGSLNLLLSTSATSPMMPSGYTYKGLIGWVYNDADGNFSHCATLAEDLFGQLGDWTHHRDTLENTIEDPGDGGTIDVSRTGTCTITVNKEGTVSITLPDPPDAGREIAIVAYVIQGDMEILSDSPVNQAGNNRLFFNASGDTIRLQSIKYGSTLRWRVAFNDSVSLSTV